MSETMICADCWHDLRSHVDECNGPLCSCDKTPETAPYFRMRWGSAIIGHTRSTRKVTN